MNSQWYLFVTVRIYVLGHTLESRLGLFGLILDKNLKVFYFGHKQRPKLGVVQNLFRFEWNQVSQISFKLKSLVFHSA